MKTPTKIALGTLIAGVLAAGTWVAVGVADPGPGGGRGPGPGHWHMGMGPMGMGGPGGALFEQLDTDKDGKVTRAELEAFRADRLKRYDRDGDGRLSLGEFEGLWAEIHRPMMVRGFQFLDSDGDGQVTSDELARATDRMFARLDRNGDGALTPDGRGMRERGDDRRGDRNDE